VTGLTAGAPRAIVYTGYTRLSRHTAAVTGYIVIDISADSAREAPEELPFKALQGGGAGGIGQAAVVGHELGQLCPQCDRLRLNRRELHG
jgi:hypothetical protein